jgi:hypothetical protein
MAKRQLPRNYNMVFGVKTNRATKDLLDQVLYKMITQHGKLITKAEAFTAVVAKWAKMKGITVSK